MSIQILRAIFAIAGLTFAAAAEEAVIYAFFAMLVNGHSDMRAPLECLRECACGTTKS